MVQADADRIWNRRGDDGRPMPIRAGEKEVTDPWGMPLQFTVERRLLNDTVTVRSSGADAEYDTLDDIVAIRTKINQQEAIRDEAANRLIDFAKKKLGEAEDD